FSPPKASLPVQISPRRNRRLRGEFRAVLKFCKRRSGNKRVLYKFQNAAASENFIRGEILHSVCAN
ncbi:hypothetical protein, partial [uncultured Campylobacter sp.]|uniref:hypothetical protein n=1 Tax=uncultured Campylobacter sp. TaxID=218934 RepID=UPI002623C5C1